MNLEITIKVLDPEMLAAGAEEISTFQTDGVFMAYNGQDGDTEVGGGVLFGEIDPEMIAQPIMRLPEYGDETLAAMLALKVFGATGKTVSGTGLSDVMSKLDAIKAARTAPDQAAPEQPANIVQINSKLN